MFHRDLFLVSLAVLSFGALASTVRNTVLDGGTQFIFYNGTLSASFVPAETSRSICQQLGPYSFGPYYNASMRIGKNPPWDENPFYFELDHFGTDYRNSNPQSARRSLALPRIPLDGLNHRFQTRQTCWSLGGCTNDAIYNLGFSTTRFECYKDGERCGTFETSPWTYVGEPNVNLTLTSIARVSDRLIDPDNNRNTGPFYSVSGDERSWIKENNRGRNAFDFQIPHNSSERDCEMNFKWNETVPFTYTVNFSNTTATEVFTVVASLGNVTLSFTGKRADGDDEELAPSNLYGQYSAISLADPNEHDLPTFTFVNGTEFKWVENKRGEWHALSGSVQQAALQRWVYVATAGGLALFLLV